MSIKRKKEREGNIYEIYIDNKWDEKRNDMQRF